MKTLKWIIIRFRDRIKAKLRDWCFKDYKWITRAQVQGEICAVMSEYRHSPLVQRALTQLRETIR